MGPKNDVQHVLTTQLYSAVRYCIIYLYLLYFECPACCTAPNHKRAVAYLEFIHRRHAVDNAPMAAAQSDIVDDKQLNSRCLSAEHCVLATAGARLGTVDCSTLSGPEARVTTNNRSTPPISYYRYLMSTELPRRRAVLRHITFKWHTQYDELRAYSSTAFI
jgi:hypothetical protein